MSIDCYQYLTEFLTQDLKEEGAVLATIAGVKGSVPREVGAKMVILGNGEIFSTVGGGAGEAKVIQVAQQVLITGEKQWLKLICQGLLPKRWRESVADKCGFG
jgi:xanthine dehydrogenase accessory factor